MKKYWFGLGITFFFIAYSLYAFAFFAWVTATPVTQEQLRQAQSLAKLWGSLSISCLIGFIVLAIRLARLYKARRKT
jgi:hypothetical protein